MRCKKGVSIFAPLKLVDLHLQGKQRIPDFSLRASAKTNALLLRLRQQATIADSEANRAIDQAVDNATARDRS